MHGAHKTWCAWCAQWSDVTSKGVAFYGSVLAGGSLPIATSLCPDELDNHGEEDADADLAEDEDVKDILPWSRDVYLPWSTFHRSKTLISLSGRA